MQTKKLMTLVKSKFFMLKANFPKHAQQIDEQPIIDSHEYDREYKFGSSSEPNPNPSNETSSQPSNKPLQSMQSMMNDPKHALPIEENSEAERQA